MKGFLFTIFAFLSVEFCSSQDSVFVINAGVKLNDVIPAKASYQYAEFLNGKVVFRDGSVSEGKLNYFRLMDEMHFINKGHDTLALDNEATIKFICIDADTFYFNKGYFMLIASSHSIKLCVKQGFRFGDKRKVAGYGIMNSTSSVTSYNSFHDGRITQPLEINEQSILYKFADYYLADKYNHVVFASKKELTDMLPGCKNNSMNFVRLAA